MTPDMQYFDQDGTWVKPPGAIRADIVLQAAGGGGSLYGVLSYGGRGQDGEIKVVSFPASDLPDAVSVTIGEGGRPGGQDGYVLVITHLTPGSAGSTT